MMVFEESLPSAGRQLPLGDRHFLRFVFLLSIAALAVLAPSRAIADEIEKFQAQPVDFSDRFETDSLKDYRTSGNVRWSTLKVTIAEKGTIAWLKTIEADWTCEFDIWPGAVDAGKPSTTRIGFALSNGCELIVAITRENRNGQSLRQVVAVLVDTPAGAATPEVEQLAVSPVFTLTGELERWSLRYRNGLLAVNSDGQLVLRAASRSLTSWSNAIVISQLAGGIELTRFDVHGRTAGYSDAQRKLYDESNSLRTEAEAAKAAGDFKLAIRTEQQRIPIMEKAFGENEVGIALVHEWVNDIADNMQRYSAVKKLSRQAADAYARAVGADHPETLRMQVFEGYAMAKLGDLDGGEKLARQAALKYYPLAGATDGRGKQVTAHVVAVLEEQATRKLEAGRFDDSQRYRQEIIQVLSASFGSESDFVSYQRQLSDITALVAQATPEKQAKLAAFQVELIRFNEQRSQGKVPTEEQISTMLSRSLEMLGKEHLVTADLLGAVGSIEFNRGDFGRALEKMEDSAAVLERLVGPDSFKFAYSEGQLGAIYSMLERYEEAAPRFEHSLQTFAKLNQKQTLFYAQIQLEYGRHLIRVGDSSGAFEQLKQCLAVFESLGALASPDAIVAIERLADLYRAVGDIASADRMLAIQKQIVEQSGDRGAGYLMTLTAEAKHLYMKREFAKSAEKYREALREIATRLGKRSRAYEMGLEGLLEVYAIQKDFEGTSRTFGELLEFARMRRESLFDTYTVQQQFQQSASDRSWLNRLMALAINGNMPAETAYEYFLSIKGAATLQQRRVNVAAANPALRELFDRRQQINSQITTLISQALTAESQQQLIELAERRNQLDREMSRSSVAFRSVSKRTTVAELLNLMPDNAAIVDYVEFERPANWLERVFSSAPRSSVAVFVLSKSGGIRLVNVGSAAAVNQALLTWARTMAEERRNMGPLFDPQLERATDEAGARLRKLVWDPIQPQLGDADLVVVSPDGMLTLCPFAAFPIEGEPAYLIERMAICHVPAVGLLPDLVSRQLRSDRAALLLIDDVDYESAEGMATRTDVANRLRFGQLPNDAGLEIDPIRRYFEKRDPEQAAIQLTRSQATEKNLRAQASRSRVIHLATHGFCVPLSLLLETPETSVHNSAATYDPLVAGIALAGANNSTYADGFADGILWASEIATLDLSGVDLVTLSACQTAVGELVPGEGLQGAQRALLVAGVSTSLTSLWSVEHVATQAMMGQFYGAAWAEERTKSEALRAAMIHMLREYPWWSRGSKDANGRRCPPWLWSSWVLYGNWQ